MKLLEECAKAAYVAFAFAPHPEGFEETYLPWEYLSEADRVLWREVAVAVTAEYVRGTNNAR